MAPSTTSIPRDQQVIDGINKDLQTMSTLYLGGKTYSPKTLTALLQSRIDAANKVATATAGLKSLKATVKALNAECNVVTQDLRHLVIAAFGAASPLLADFGFKARSRKPQTPEQKAARNRRDRARRALAKARSKKTTRSKS